MNLQQFSQLVEHKSSSYTNAKFDKVLNTTKNNVLIKLKAFVELDKTLTDNDIKVLKQDSDYAEAIKLLTKHKISTAHSFYKLKKQLLK